MSWLFSQALVVEYLGENFSDGEPSAPLNGNPTQLAYCVPDKMTDFSRLSRSGMTFAPLTADRGEALLMSFLEAFPVRTSPSQDEAMAWTESDQDCGERWRGWLAKYDPATSSWRTAQGSLLSEEPELLETLPRLGMTRDGLLWEQPMLERPISATGSGLWPTPTASMMPCEGTVRIMRKKWQAGEITLEEASVVAGRDVRLSQGKVPAMWPTPAARDYKGANGHETTQLKLAQGKRAQMGQLPNAVQQELGKPIGGSLNPMWVEWLMGWPLGWTDLKPLVTDKSPSALPKHGDS